MGKYHKVKKEKYADKQFLAAKIAELADQIRDGDEDLVEGYNNYVQEFITVTRMQAPARESDPLMYDALCEDWGRDPGKTIQYGGKREMNYLECLKFTRGYWR